MNTAERLAAIKNLITAALTPEVLEVTDDSHLHIGHKGANGAGHFSVRLKSAHFANKSLIECHRLIYKAVASLMLEEIHALKIDIIK